MVSRYTTNATAPAATSVATRKSPCTIRHSAIVVTLLVLGMTRVFIDFWERRTPGSSGTARENTGSQKLPLAYAFLFFGVDPNNIDSFGPYLANVLVATKLLRRFKSPYDIVVLIKMTFHTDGNNVDRKLPDFYEDLLVEGYGVKLRYLPNEPDITGFTQRLFAKFYVFNLTEYDRVTFLDGDLIPFSNIDYLMELSYHGVLEPTVAYATGMEPANAGFFVFTPSADDFLVMHQKMSELAAEGENHVFDEQVGWGHVIQPPDEWQTSWGTRGTNWTFLFASGDQGYLYYYAKYVKHRLTNIIGNKIITYGLIQGEHNNSIASTRIIDKDATAAPNSSTSSMFVGITKEIEINSLVESPFASFTQQPPRQRHILPSNCYRHSQSTFCPPPYRDFVHFTGPGKPWKTSPPHGFPYYNTSIGINDTVDTRMNADMSFWWGTLGEIFREQAEINKDWRMWRTKLETFGLLTEPAS